MGLARIAFIASAAAAVALLGGIAAAQAPASEGGQPAATVTMAFGFKFQPQEVRVRVGETVEWRNKSLTPHTATFDPSKASNANNVMLPAGVEPFDSGSIEPGATWRHRFMTPGTYRYVSQPHEGQGMTGTVIVRPN